VSTIGSVVLAIEANSAVFQREIAKVQRDVSGLNRSFNDAASAAKSLATGLGIGFGTAAVAGLANMAANAVRAAEAIGETAKQVGLSTDALQKLQFQAQQSGSSAETLAAGMATFARSMGQAEAGTGRMLSQFEKLDPLLASQIRQARDQEQALGMVADALARSDSAAKDAAIAVAAFGDAGKELAPVFNDGAAGIASAAAEAERLGVIMDREVIDAAMRTSDQLSALSDVIGINLVNSIGRAAVEFAHLTGLMGESRIEAIQRELQQLSQITEGVPGLIAPSSPPAVMERRNELLMQLRLEMERSQLPMQQAAAAAEELDRAYKPLEIDIRKAAEAQQDFVETLKFDSEADRKLKQLRSVHANADRIAEAARQTERVQEDQNRILERNAERQAELILEPFKNAAQSIQSTLSDTFVEAFEGGITSAQDAASAIKNIFTRMAADIAAAHIMRPAMAALSGVPFGGSAALSPAATTPGGVPIHALGGTGAAGMTAARALGFGAAGAAGGAMLGGFFGGRGAIGGALGGGLGAIGGGALAGTAIMPGIGTGVGALIGGVAGSLFGGGIGSLFGGGGGQSNRVSIGGGFGAGAGGTGSAAQFVQQIDASLQGLLSASQEAIANRALQMAAAVRVQYSKTPSQNDLNSLAAGRIGPVASALGFQNVAIGNADQMQQNLQTAIGTQRTLEGFRLGNLGTQLRDINDTFQEMAANASKFGISLEGLAAAHQKAAEAAVRQRNAEFFSVAEAVGAMTSEQAALELLNVQMQDAAARAQELGVPLTNIAAKHRELAAALVEQNRAARDAALLTAINPFEQMLDQLQNLGLELNTSLLNPLRAAEAAAANFRDIAAQAASGSLEAIEQFDDAARLFVQTATAVGASPGQVAATAEIDASRQGLIHELESARNEAQRGMEREFRAAAGRIVDSVQELTAEVRQAVRRVT
jgi:hypothetical protein